MNNTTEAVNGSDPISCEAAYILEPRIYMASFGFTLSILSFFCNVLIALVLIKSKHSHFFFFALLAISDSFLSIMYGPVVAMEVMKDVFRELWLNRLYWNYMPSLLTASNICMTFSTLLIILATTERFMITIKSERLRWFRTHRGLLAGFALITACLLKGGILWEIDLILEDACVGTLGERQLAVGALASTFIYGVVFKFYIRQICTVLFPFIFLIFLNAYIVMTLRKQRRAAALFRFATSRHKTQVRSATILTVVIVFSFLVSNALNVFFTIVEFWDYGILEHPDVYQYYEYGTDAVSVMYIFVCATRLIVYVVCNEEIRDEVSDAVCRYICRCSPYSRKGFRKQNNSSSKGAAAEMDSFVLTMGRRFITADLTDTATMNDEEEETSDKHDDAKSPIEAIVIANGYTHCNSDDV